MTFQVKGQSLINGNFESNTAPSDQINLSNNKFNELMSDILSFGSSGNLDILESNRFSGGPQSGDWFIAMTGGGTDVLSIPISEALVEGHEYFISFFDKADITFPALPIEIGLSSIQDDFGTLIYTTNESAVTGIWQERNFSFSSPFQAEYITARPQGSNQSWVHVDNFKIEKCIQDVNIGNDTTLCPGETLTLQSPFIELENEWQDGSAEPSFLVSEQGLFSVSITDNCGTISDSINVNYESLLILDIGNDTTICDGDTIAISPVSNSSNFTWQDNSNNSILNVSESGIYILVVSNICASLTDSITIITENCNCEFYIPNVFTPNSNNINSAFLPLSDCQPEEFYLSIFDRWGNKIFETNNYLESWNGRFRDQLLDAGTYAYKLEFKFKRSEESKILGGSINLLR